jgi:sugar phosphate permease
MGKEVGARQPDDDEGSITSGSPGNLVLVAVVVGLLFFAGLVFYITAIFADSDVTRDNWWIAETILVYIGGGIFSAGLLVGLGTVATARSKGVSSRATAVASLVSKAGAAVIILGVAEAVCIVGANQYGLGWQFEASQVAFRVGSSVFEGGVLAGLALICLRQGRRGSPADGQP